MKNIKFYHVFILIVVLILAACAAPTPAPTAQPTQAPVVQPTQAAQATQPPATVPTSAAQKKTIKIGLYLPMTGALAFLGEGYKLGVDLAIKDLGSNIDGNPLELVVADSKGNPTDAVTAARKLIEVDQVDAIIGGGASSATLGAVPIIGEGKTPAVDGSSTNSTIYNMMGKGGNIWQFRIAPDDLIMGQGFAEYVAQRAKSLVFVADDNQFGRGAGQVYMPAFKKLNLKVASEDYFDPATTDYRPALTRMKASGADALLIVMTEQSCATFFRQYLEVGLKLQTFSRGSCTTGLFHQLTADNPAIGEGLIEFSFFAEGLDPKLDAHFLEVYKQPITPHRFAGYYIMYYTYAPAIRSLIQAGKPINRANIRDALTALKIDTSAGTLSFDDHNQAYPKSTLSTNKGGKTILLDTAPLKPVDHTGF
jgi:branched-chain amino acid transport system substrate-binding protein